MYLFVPALVQPRPTGIGGKRCLRKATRRRLSPPGRFILRAIWAQLPPDFRQVQPGDMAPASGRSPTPSPSQSLAPASTPRSAPKQSSSSCAPGGTPCCSPPRRLALSSTCRNPGDKLLLAQAIRLGGHSDSMVCLARGLPARHIACPAHDVQHRNMTPRDSRTTAHMVGGLNTWWALNPGRR